MNCRVCNEVYSVKELEAVVEKWHAGEQSYATDQCTHTLEGDDYIMTPACPNHLSLLVIDLGDSCVVKVEKGEIDMVPVGMRFGSIRITQHFERLKNDLSEMFDESRPVPRIERCGDAKYPEFYDLIGPIGHADRFGDESYKALSQLAGHDLPIYEPELQGTWTELYPFDVPDSAVLMPNIPPGLNVPGVAGVAGEVCGRLGTFLNKQLPFTAWRYER
jgi:hypothetical protein